MQQNLGTTTIVTQQEQIIPMNIKMMNNITTNVEAKIASYEGAQITYLNVIARKECNYQKENKGYILINDDTGVRELIILLRSEIDQNLYFKINSDEKKLYYYNFILRARVFQANVVFDIQTIQQIEQASMMIYQIIRVATYKLQISSKKQSGQHFPVVGNNTLILIDEAQQQKQQSTLSDEIFYQIKLNGQNGTPLQKIVDYFLNKGIYDIFEIKKAISILTINNLIVAQEDKFYAIKE